MIKFEVDKLSVEVVHLKSCTTALGGSIRVVDEERTEQTGKEVYTKINAPIAVVRAFQQKHNTSNYFKPVATAVVYYGDHIVAIERHPLGSLGSATFEGLDGNEVEWTPESQKNIEQFIEPLCMHNEDWYIDGKYLYRFSDDLEQSVHDGELLSSDGNFRAVEVSAIKLSSLDDRTGLDPTARTCLAFVSKSGKFAVTPPIWKTLSNMSSSALSKSGSDDHKFQFDAIDQHLAVNLSFALKAGKEISELFGYHEIEPLNLPELMVKLQTVNLPNVAKSVKDTYDIGMNFSHAAAWLIGMSSRINTLDSFIVIRSLLKYLTTKGIFRKNMFNTTAVFRTGHDLDDIPKLSTDEALEFTKTLSTDELLERIRMKAAARRNNGHTVAGGLYDAD